MSFKRRIAKFVKSKGGKATIIGTTAFLLIGITALVLGYGLKDGWQVVLNWFTSRYAMFVYVGIGFYILLILYIIVLSQKYED